MYKVQVCEECGQPFDDTGYPICGDCNTQTFIKLEDTMKKPTTKKGKIAKVGKVMREFKKGELHSGKGGKIVKNPKQAIAISLSVSGLGKKKGK
jgi:hypothetical protein